MDMRLNVPRVPATCKKVQHLSPPKEFQRDLLGNQNRFQHHIFIFLVQGGERRQKQRNRLNDALDLKMAIIELVDCVMVY